MKKYFEEVNGKVKVISEKKLQKLIGSLCSKFLIRRMFEHGYSTTEIASVAERSEWEVLKILNIRK